MKIIIDKRTGLDRSGKDAYWADWIDRPGSPRLGYGETPEEAVANLFYIIYTHNPALFMQEMQNIKDGLSTIVIERKEADGQEAQVQAQETEHTSDRG